jgi:ceramide glucosyltransferase
VFCVFIAVGVGAHLVALVSALAFSLRRYRYAGVGGFTPPVTILKPVRGLNTGDEENFRTFFLLRYPEYEILFLVHRDAGDDPAIACIEKLIAEYPDVRARILRTSRKLAVHEKVNNYLEGIEKASYEIICITDADAYVDGDYLSRDVKPLSDPAIGLVTSFQTMNDFRCPAPAFEGLMHNFDGLVYWKTLYVLGRLNIIYGHSVLFRKTDFFRVNAFDEIKDHLIDDRAMGVAFVDKGGLRIEISPRIIPTRYPVATWRKAASHMLRWRQFYRIYSPVGTLAMVMYYMSFWGLLALGASALLSASATLLGLPLRPIGFAFGGIGVGLRYACVAGATLIAGDKKRDLRYFWTVLLSEPYAIYAHIACFFIRSFVHAGRRYTIVGSRMRLAEEDAGALHKRVTGA